MGEIDVVREGRQVEWERDPERERVRERGREAERVSWTERERETF